LSIPEEDQKVINSSTESNQLTILRRTETAMSEKDRDSYDQSNVWDEVDGQEKH